MLSSMHVWLAKFGNDNIVDDTLIGVYETKEKAINAGLKEAYVDGGPYIEVKHSSEIWARYQGQNGFYVEVDSWEVL